MALKIQLKNDLIGSVTSDNAIGLDKLEIALKRGKDNDGLIYGFTVELEFTKDLKDFIYQAYEAEGIEGIVTVTLYEYNSNTYQWESFYTGKLKLTNYVNGEITLKSNIDQTGLQVKFDNLQETNLDAETTASRGGVTLPETGSIDLNLHSRRILVQYRGEPSDNVEYQQEDVILYQIPSGLSNKDGISYFNIEAGGGSLRELEEVSTYSWGFYPLVIDFVTNNGESAFVSETYLAKRSGLLDVDINLRMRAEIRSTMSEIGADMSITGCGVGSLGNHEVSIWFEHRDGDDNVINKIKVGDILTGCGGANSIGDYVTVDYQAIGLDVPEGHKVYVYGSVRIFGNYNNGEAGVVDILHELRIQADPAESYIKLSNGSVYPETQTKAVMIYELMRKAAQFMTDKEDCFRSDVLGRPEIVEAGANPYLTDGEAALIAIAKGGAIRGLDEKTLFVNWSDIFKSVSACYNLGWGFEKADNGAEVVRVEKREHFYKSNTMILDLGQVSGVTKEVAPEYYFISAIMAFPKIDIGQTNGIDEFNSERTYWSPLTEVKNKQEIRSVYRASGAEIEFQRRLRESSEDSKLDDENFLIAVKRDGLNFRSEKGSDFLLIDNVFDPDSVYNPSLAPSRNVFRWLNTLAPSVFKLVNKNFEFGSGTGNYKMRSQAPGEGVPLAEDRSFNLSTVVPLFIPEVYRFDWELKKSQFKFIQDEPYGYIRFRDEKNVICDGYVLDVKRVPGEDKGSFKLLRVFRL